MGKTKHGFLLTRGEVVLSEVEGGEGGAEAAGEQQEPTARAVRRRHLETGLLYK